MAHFMDIENLGGDIASRLLLMLNFGNVQLKSISPTTFEEEEAICTNDKLSHVVCIITDVEPKELHYPENWYYDNGSFRNKYMPSTGVYSEIPMMKSDKTPWGEIEEYCTNKS